MSKSTNPRAYPENLKKNNWKNLSLQVVTPKKAVNKFSEQLGREKDTGFMHLYKNNSTNIDYRP